ncbi:hypothetical protein ILUMI_25205 [Ignelater luminosus]|uniref:Uncharacterized protein n=1 Tax=Ignelater luminosus TaxID=2038154 RepID=A0A8K0C5W8_IGNLU|nr:hypothetical protein ILUMI_25205 [Ignelater luminosus]
MGAPNSNCKFIYIGVNDLYHPPPTTDPPQVASGQHRHPLKPFSPFFEFHHKPRPSGHAYTLGTSNFQLPATQHLRQAPPSSPRTNICDSTGRRHLYAAIGPPRATVN